jgi:DNA-binding response OmpR family regulator
LEEEGYSTVTLCSGKSLKDLLNTKFPDLILMDILLGDEDGKDICKDLKSKFNFPIILMSANNFTERDIKNSMADNYLRKPFNLDTLVKTVEAYV